MKLILLVGPPGSGKSTLAKNLVTGDVYVNQDSQGKNEHIDIFRNAIYEKQNIIVDRMNFNKEQRARYLTMAKEHGYETKIIVLHQPFDVCYSRALARTDHETIKDEKSARSALEFFFKSYQRPTPDEADEISFIYPEGEKPFAIICDLDGTLADCEHRRHHVRREDGQKKDWRSFFLRMSDDTVIEPVLETIRLFVNSGKRLVYCSGRPDDYKKLTVEWLARNRSPLYSDLFMRRRHDSRQDDIVKEIILDFEILPRYCPLFVLDDRDQVVAMWRRRGLMCFQVNPGDF